MSRNRLVRSLVVCSVMTLAAQTAWAGPARPGASSDSAWALLIQFWNSFTSDWSKVGCIIDPNGGCGDAQAPAPPPQTKVGCIADPNGGSSAGG